MSCPSCGFFNLPGTERCGRCGARLFAAQEESFLPRRVGSGERIRRRLWSPFSALAALVAGAGSNRPAAGRGPLGRALWTARVVIQPDPMAPLLVGSPLIAALLSLVPGLGHLYVRRFLGAAILMPLGVVSFLVAARFYGTPPAVWAMSLYSALAVASIFLVGSVRVEGTRWLRFVVMMVLLLLLWPLQDLAMQRANRLWPTFYVTLERDHGPFESGTLLEFRRHAFDLRPPDLGEVVMTRTLTVDRVLGLPGDHLEWKEEALYRNGERQDASLRPLSFGGNPPEFEVDVPADSYFVLPVAVGYESRNPITFRNTVLPAALVPEGDIWYSFAGEVPVPVTGKLPEAPHAQGAGRNAR